MEKCVSSWFNGNQSGYAIMIGAAIVFGLVVFVLLFIEFYKKRLIKRYDLEVETTVKSVEKVSSDSDTYYVFYEFIKDGEPCEFKETMIEMDAKRYKVGQKETMRIMSENPEFHLHADNVMASKITYTAGAVIGAIVFTLFAIKLLVLVC